MSNDVITVNVNESNKTSKHRIGLVFDGGGAKGAYQIGVWRALRETGLEQYVTDIAGTSVGGLNAALFVKGDLEEAERIWANEISSIHLSRIQMGVSELIEKYLSDMSIFRETKECHDRPMNCYITTYNISGNDDEYDMVLENGIIKKIICGKAVYFNMRVLLPEECSETIKNAAIPKSVLLATSALPFLCPLQKIEDKYYLDGGLAKNSPVYPLLEATKCDTIIVIHLDSDVPFFKKNQVYNDVDVFENGGVSVLNIVPSQDAGHLLGTLDFSREKALKLMYLGYNDTKKAFEAIVKNWTKEVLFTEDSEMFRAIEHLSPEDKYRLYNECEFLVHGNYAKLNYLSEDGFGKTILRVLTGGGIKAKKQILENTVELQQKMKDILVCLDDEMQNIKQGMHYLFYRSLTISDVLLAQHQESKVILETLKDLLAQNEHNKKFLADKFSDYIPLDITSTKKKLEELTSGIDIRIECINELNEQAMEIHNAQIEAVAKRISEAKQLKIVRFTPEKVYVISSNGIEEKTINVSSGYKSWNMIDKKNFFQIFGECSSSAIILPEEHKHPPAKIIYPSDYFMYLWFICTPLSERIGKKVCMADFHNGNLYFHGYRVNDDGSNYIELHRKNTKPIGYHAHKMSDKINELFDIKKDDDILFYKTFGVLRNPTGRFERTLNALGFIEVNSAWEKKLAENSEDAFVNFVDRFISRIYE